MTYKRFNGATEEQIVSKMGWNGGILAMKMKEFLLAKGIYEEFVDALAEDANMEEREINDIMESEGEECDECGDDPCSCEPVMNHGPLD